MKPDPTIARPSAGALHGAGSATSRGGWRPRRAWGTLDSYVLRQAIAATFTGLSWFLGLLLVAVVITGVQKVVSKALSPGEMALFVAYQVPRMMLFALPMATLFGAVQTFAALSRENEVTAMSAAGASLSRLLRAPLLLALSLSAFTFWLQDAVVPPLERNKDALLVRQVKSKLGAMVGFRFEDPPSDQGPLRRIIQASRFDPETNTLLRPRVQLFNADREMYLQISAQKARWDGRSWIFQNGKSVRLGDEDEGERGAFASSTFGEARVDVPAPSFLRGGTDSSQKRLRLGDFLMFSLLDVAGYRERLWASLPPDRASPEFASTWKLLQSSTFGVHEKIATPLVCLAFALVGVPLGMHSPRSGNSGAMGLSLLVLLLYYVGWTWASTLGRAGAVSPILMAYLAPAVVAVGGAILVWRRGR